MINLSACQSSVAESLAPHGLYFQTDTLEDETYQGFPIEPGLLLIAGIAVATFCHAFLKEFGAETGRMAGKKSAAWLASLRRTKYDAPSSKTRAEEGDATDIVQAVQDSVKGLRAETYRRFRVRAVEAIQLTLIERGLPRRGSHQVAVDVVRVIEIELEIPLSDSEA